ncbi:MAG: hypothetical protein L6R38_000962 [Xanthoria sp. 2 TBL-2021]|nr:MAG: hypothetical protein L6R38_000962 [Xanthoria sp. 2 TBL-2021]
MSESIQSKTPRLDNLISKFPDEVLPIWTLYCQSKRTYRTRATWEIDTSDLGIFTKVRGDRVAALPGATIHATLRDEARNIFEELGTKLVTASKALQTMHSLVLLRDFELQLAAGTEKAELLEAERLSGSNREGLLEEIDSNLEEMDRIESRLQLMAEGMKAITVLR